jgi:hypothetical protein
MPFSRLGEKQYGTQDWQEFSAYGFQGGLNIKSVPQDVDDGDLTQAINVRLRADGGVEQRLGYSSIGGSIPLVSPGSNPTYGGVRFNQLLSAGVSVSNKYLLQQYNLNRLINSSTGLEAPGATNPAFTSAFNPLTPWTTAVILDPNVGAPNGLGYTAATDTLIIACGGDGPYYYDGVHPPYAPNGTSGGGTGIANSSAARGATLVQVVNNVVFFSGCAANPNIVFATSLYVGAVPGTGPEYYYQSFRMSSPVTSLGIIGSGAQAALVVGSGGKTLTMIYGTYPGNYNIQDIPVGDGPVSARCNVSLYGQYFYLGRQGFYRFDGQSAPQRLSDKIEPWILGSTITSPSFAMLGDRSRYWAYYYNNRIGIVYDSTGANVLNTILVYDLVNSGWTVYQTPDSFIAFSALDGPGDPSPTQAVKFSQNSGAQWFWDVNSTGSSTCDQYNGTTQTPISASFQTKFFKVGVPGTPKKVTRWYPEFFSSGVLNVGLTISNDYGTSAGSHDTFSPQTAGGAFFYDGTARYDSASSPATTWGAAVPIFYGAPQTRTDILATYTDANNSTFSQSGIQGEAFSFGVNSSNISAPWIFQGLTGTYAQEARV